MSRPLDPGVAGAATDLGVDVTGAGRHAPIAAEAARRAGLDLDRIACWMVGELETFAAALSALTAEGREVLRLVGRLDAARTWHGVDSIDELPPLAVAEALETTLEGVPAAVERINTSIPAGLWQAICG